MYQNKYGFKDTPDSLPIPAFDDSQEKAEAALMPNTISPDSAFYSSAQYAELTQGNTRARVTVKHLPDGSVDL